MTGPDTRRVLISGSSGVIGTALLRLLAQSGYQVSRLVRSREETGPDAVYWNPARSEIDTARCEGFDAVVHLAGVNLAGGRLTGERKRKVVESRVLGTSLLCRTLAQLERQPRVLVSAAGIGFYGERGEEILTEQSGKGNGFLADLCRDWELATVPAAEVGIRVVRLRTAPVMTRTGDPLKTLMLVFRLGMGGPLGNGRQWFSWIALADHIRAVHHAMETGTLSGPVNSAAPHPVRQKEFARTLGQLLHRPAIFPVPEFALNLRFGRELGQATLWSQRVIPEKLTESGFTFQFPDLETALRHESRI